MNTDPMVHTGNTVGQRVRMAAFRVAEVLGGATLLTALAVEGGAALNVDTALVQPAEAGTGIQGVVITGGCNPSSNQPQLTIRNNTSGRLDFRRSVNDGPVGFAGTVEPNNSLTRSATTGDRYVHTADQIPGAQDVEVIPACGGTTTTAGPTTSTSAPAPTTTSTTRSPNTGVSIPGGEQGTPVTAGPTTSTPRGGNEGPSGQPGPDGESGDDNITTATTTRLAGPATPQTGRSLALTGNKTANQTGGAIALTAAGGLLLILGRRKPQAA